MIAVDYMAVLGDFYPHIDAVCFGDPFNYADIQVENDSVLPSQDELDTHVLSRYKQLKVVDLSTACRLDVISGFESSGLGYPCMYDSTEVDQLNLAGSLLSISPTSQYPDGTTAYYAIRPVVDGVVQPKTYVEHTYLQLRQVVIDGVAFKLARLQKFNAKRDYINDNCSTQDQVDAVTWDSVEPS